ncbi:hypothetical protein BH09VER1_BH09VER1_21570 [soil metagenome]
MTPLAYPDLPEGDFGFGSAYERVALYAKITRWAEKWGEDKLAGLEGFYDCFAGLPGLHLLPLARAGGKVTVACQSKAVSQAVETVYRRAGLLAQLNTIQARRPDDVTGQEFDVVLLFNPFPFITEWESFLEAAARRSRTYLIVSVCSRSSYGIAFRRLMKKIKPSSGTGLDLFEHPTSDPVFFRSCLAQYGEIIEEDYFDVPWWPDFYGGPGDTVLTWMLKQFGWKPKPSPPVPHPPLKLNHYYPPDSFPYFGDSPQTLACLRQKIARHPTFDNLPYGLLKSFFAHHRIFVVRRPSPA